MDSLAVLSLPATRAAPLLLGWQMQAHGVVLRIAEVEAYQGESDLACHASRGRTPRTAILYGPPGRLYVYLCYGIHQMVNLVCDGEGLPAAVLIRGAEVVAGHDLVRERRRGDQVLNGPGKVAQALALERSHTGSVLAEISAPSGERRGPVALCPPDRPASRLERGPRVGVDYAGPIWSTKPWRWWIPGFPIARPPGAAGPGKGYSSPSSKQTS